jgi:hypothetical protein
VTHTGRATSPDDPEVPDDLVGTIRSMPLRPARHGVSKEDAEALREAALNAVTPLALRLRDAEMEVMSVRRQGAGQVSQEDVLAAMRRMGPDALNALGAGAVGRVLVEAEQAAAAKVAAATSMTRLVLSNAVTALQEAVMQLGRARSPAATIAIAEDAIMRAAETLENGIPQPADRPPSSWR